MVGIYNSRGRPVKIYPHFEDVESAIKQFRHDMLKRMALPSDGFDLECEMNHQENECPKFYAQSDKEESVVCFDLVLESDGYGY